MLLFSVLMVSMLNRCEEDDHGTFACSGAHAGQKCASGKGTDGCAVISNATRSAMGLPLLSDSERFGSYKNAIATNGFSYEEIEENAFIDFVDIHLRAAWMYLGEIIGETSSESLLDELFSKFCLGK